MMFTINEYNAASKVIDDTSSMAKEAGDASVFSFYGLAPQSVTIPEEWMKSNKEAIPYLVDLVFRLAKVFGGWGNSPGDHGRLPQPPSVVDDILAQKELRFHRYDFSGSPYVLSALDRILTTLQVKHETKGNDEEMKTESVG